VRLPEDEEVPGCIDSQQDTSWPVPPLAAGASSHELVFELKRPARLKPSERLVLAIDSGGRPNLDTISRVRVSFPE
jgi:hypothetical protein